MTSLNEDPPNSPPPTSRLRTIGREVLINAGIIGLVVLAMMWWQREGQKGGGGKLTVGAPAPPFSLRNIHTGESVSLESLQGRPTIVNFWATWCGPCVRELPIMEALHHSGGTRYQLVTITQEPPSVVIPFLAQRGLTLPTLFDPGGAVGSAYRATQIPTTVILDGDGRIVHDFSGGAYEDILREHMARLTVDSPRAADP